MHTQSFLEDTSFIRKLLAFNNLISYNNAKTIQVNTIAHKIVPACVVVAICLGTLIWQEVRHLTHSIRSSEFTRLCFKATHLVLLLLLH